ncbi:MAG: outer membrane protein assembly factor BamA [Thermodesulfobacteriota bacterium]|nr:outer membrane protein assembly factor BamA [Thermodesulfobacteriota bacterium]
MFLLLSFMCQLIPIEVRAEKEDTVAFLPFNIHSLKPLDHLKEGLQEMFTARMAKKGVHIISPEFVNKNPTAFLPLFEMENILVLGKKLGAHWVITGSLTQIGSKISLDLKVVDITAKKPPFSIFIVEDDIDNLADAADRAVTSIYNQISGVIQIDSIQVRGNKRIEKEAILAVVQSKKGEGINSDQLDKDLRSIYKMGFFKDVNIKTEDGPGGKIVIFSVVEKPSIASIVFDGNKEIEDKDLRKECGIKKYSILSRNEITQSINRLKEYYRQKGYYNVLIDEKIKELPQNEISLIYEIDEGEKVYITKIEFIGNTKFDDDDLKDIMETSEKGFLSLITKSGLLDKKKLEFDLHKITSFYYNQGYIKAKAGEPKISYEKGKGITVTIEIVEGPPYSVNKVEIAGVEEEDLIENTDELLNKVSITNEKLFNREVVRKDSLTLRNIYADEGYAYASVTPMIKEDDLNHLVDITYNISKGKKIRFERINISGNTVTRDKVVRRELKVIEGEYFSGKDLKRSTENLHRLGYFEDVEIKPKKGSQDDLMMLDINVKEKATGSFSVGAGYSSFDGALGMFQISQSNLFGYGQKLQATARLGGKTTDFDVKFTEPWLFGKPISAGVDAMKWEKEYDEYTKDSLGGALRFQFPIGIDEDFTRGSLNYAYENADIYDIDNDAAIEIKDMAGNNVTSSITIGLKRNSKDKPFHTTKGSVNSLTMEYAGGFLGGDSYFTKYLASSAWYFPFLWKTVFMARGQWGYVEERSGGKLPIYQKFRLGGIDTVRGFDYASISPKDPASGDKIGGEKFMSYNLEYRFPVLKKFGIIGVVFLDAGNVFMDNESYSFSGIKKSAGTGIRWYSPVGPLRVEYGKNLDPLEDESSGEWEFSVGGVF